MYTPPKTAHWEGMAMTVLQQVYAGPPLDEPLTLIVHAVAERPKRLMRAKDPHERLLRTAKPEGDNVLKCVGDALTKAGVIRDDACIVEWSVLSVYAAKDEGPCVELCLGPARNPYRPMPDDQDYPDAAHPGVNLKRTTINGDPQ